MISRRALTDPRILALPGGERILEARGAARRLLARLPGLRPAGRGSPEGSEDLSRRGRLEHLLLSEHMVDDDEFLRRRFHGEQIHLSREAVARGPRRATLIWDLGIEALGAPRLAALGVALALRTRGAEDGSPLRVLAHGERTLDLETIEGLRDALELPPSMASDARRALRMIAADEDEGGIFLLTSDRGSGEAAAREGSRLAAVFVAESHLLTLLASGRRGSGIGGATSATLP